MIEVMVLQEKWLQVLEPRSKWYQTDFKGVWQYRDLIYLFVRRNFKVSYQQTILGPAWILLSPLMTTLVFNVVFGTIAGISVGGVPRILFNLIGVSVWGLFSGILTQTSNTFISNRSIFSKVYFSRLVMPISGAISSLMNFFIQLLMFLIFWVYFFIQGAVVPTLALLVLPLLLVEIMVLGLGCGLVVASFTTRYRDLQVLVGFGLSLALYATPVAWPLSRVTGWLHTLMLFNPMAPIVEAFRYAFLGSGEFLPTGLLIGAAETLVLVGLGLLAFNRIEKTFVDTI